MQEIFYTVDVIRHPSFAPMRNGEQKVGIASFTPLGFAVVANFNPHGRWEVLSGHSDELSALKASSSHLASIDKEIKAFWRNQHDPKAQEMLQAFRHFKIEVVRLVPDNLPAFLFL